MKEITLLELRFSNVMSYGNNVNVFIFPTGVNWIKGINGTGKSSIIEALTYVLFGESYRSDVKLDDLINSTNKKGLIVELDLATKEPNGELRKFTIRRGLKPKLFEIIQHKDDGTKVALNKEAGMVQSNLETDILGFDLRLFTNVISLNTLETKPFLDMKPEDKRKLIESIITFDISKIKKKIASDLSLANTKFTTSSSDVKLYTQKIEELNGILLRLEEEKKSGIEELISELNIAVNEKKNIEGKLVFLNEEYNKLLISGKDLVSKTEPYKELDVKISNINHVINIMDDVSSIRTNFEKYTVDLVEQNKVISKIEKQLEKFINSGKDNEEKFNKLTNPIQEISQLESKIFYCKSEMDKVKKHAEEIAVGVPCATCGKPSTEEDKQKLVESYREQWKGFNTTFKEANARLAVLKTEKEAYDLLNKEVSEYKSELSKIQQSKFTEERVKRGIEDNISSLAKQIESKKQQSLKLIPDFDIDKGTKEQLERKLSDYNENKKILDSLNAQIQSLREVASAKKAEILATDGILKNIISKESELNGKIALKKAESDKDSIGVTKTEIEKSKSQLEISKETMLKASDDILILKFMTDMYGDDGIKKTIIGTFVPVLNKAIEKNLRVFELPFSVEFDEGLSYQFCNGLGSAPTYFGLSQGQKRKLHFSISMAFRDFVSMVGDFKINILFLDEVLDISVDDIGLETMIEILKSKREIDCIYVMTHRGEGFASEWDHVTQITHDGTYSELTIVR